MKTIIDIKGVITNVNNKEITEKEYDEFVDLFLELIESKSCSFGGGFAHCSEKEWIKENQ
jgi:hypothetical protein